MPYERTTVHIDKQEAGEALEKAKKAMPDWDINLSDLIRVLLRKVAKGEIKL